MVLTKKKLVIAVAALAPFTVMANEQGSSNQQEPQRLQTIVVSAALTEQNIDKAPASISVITSEQIERSAALSVADVLQKEAGVYNYNSGQDKIVIRGMQDTSGSYTLILLNGKRTSSSGAMWRGNDFDWSSIPLNSIERIEVIRGPMSSLYGSDAMGGVINIITKKAKPGEIHGSVFTQFNRVDSGKGKNQSRYGFNLNGGLTDGVRFNLSGDAYNRDAWYKQQTDASAYFVEKETTNLNGTLNWDINDQQALDLDVNYNKDKRPLTQDTNWGSQEMEMDRTNIGLTHRGNWGWGKTEAYIGKETAKIDDYDTDYDAPQKRHYKQDNLIARGFTNFDWLMNNTTLGADYKDQKITDPISYTTGSSKQKSYGVFVQNDTHITDAFTATVGGRYDHFDNFDGKATGKAYLAYELADGIVLKGGFGQAYKVPGPYQLDENYRLVSCGGSCFIRGNANLKPEESNNYEASLIVTQPNWNFNITAFQNDVKNLIERIKDPAPTDPKFPNKWDNVAKAELKGVEVAAGYDFSDAFGVKGNATYLDAKNKITDKDLTERPEWMANAFITWTPVENYKMNFGASYIGQQMLSATEELPSYTTYDVTLTSNLTQNLTLDYGVKNLTDVDLKDKDEGFNTKLYGRNYFVKVTFSF
ncbi:TonB-dependent receptor [Acinetobacter sp. VNH17]|uniref:TonB-dependent receptor n=1 Tax=Acinetobacter thutiue TaxID=2998078 RepID=A0ABT7WK78_9GAMM|nr:TonB-dependent receptor [Acinetobacter thutiue]MCY6410989.1 TonB-dependent receptor [Acinetobacter thutiue]MDN0013091.1 TonB-dependent receptor [Acinetobacter thutiue]